MINMSESIHENFRYGLKYLIDNRLRESQAKMAEKIGYHKQSITNYKDGRTRPGQDFMQAVADYFGYGLIQILNIGQRYQNGEPISLEEEDNIMEQFQIVPMVRARPEGGTSSLEVEGEIDKYYSFRKDFLFRRGSPNSMVMMRVKGDSMHPYISNGDVILVDQSQNHPHDGIMCLVRIDDDIVVKWIQRKPGKIILKSENDLWEDMEIDKGDESINFEVIGKVIWIGKEIT